MYTVVSVTVDLAGEPDTIDFTLAVFWLNLLLLWIPASRRLVSRRVLTPNRRSRHAL